jgi:response regulator NasT
MATFVIADDSAIMRDRLRSYLREEGHQIVGIADGGPEAVQLVRRYQPDAVILDIAMPKGDGLTAAEELAKDGSKRIVFIVSSASMASLAARAKAVGATFIAKPFDRQTLAATVRMRLRG